MEKKLPFKLGYVMPAEWEMHEATWLSWPKNPDSFPDEIIGEVENTYAAMIEALSRSEKVYILVDNNEYESKAGSVLKSKDVNFDNVSFQSIRTADVWFRDYGPIFIKKGHEHGKGEIALTHWKFNAWGNKYEDLKQDTHIPEKIETGNIQRFEVPIVLEGGSIDVNGMGACLTTEQCLLNSNRNPHLDRYSIEQYLKDYLGATKVIWLKGGILGDDTDGHVDDIARFVSSDTVVCAVEGNTKDGNYLALKDNFSIISQATDQSGKKIKVVQLPMPEPVTYNNLRLPASYANFYIANKAVLVPIFGSKNDQKALNILQGLFRGRDVIGINCRALVYGFGAIHCVTQQQPMPTGI